MVKNNKKILLEFDDFVLERSSGTNNWNTFHAAAESVTMLYKGKRKIMHR